MSNTTREILFRGNRKDNGERVYGAYGNHTHLDAMIIDKPYLTSNGDLSALNFWMVDPATVGQFTGIRDKNGTKIFEGDIVKIFNLFTGQVVSLCSAFGVKCDRQINFGLIESTAKCGKMNDTPEHCNCGDFISFWELIWNWGCLTDKLELECDFVEVIGNVHDMPELLEVSNE